MEEASSSSWMRLTRLGCRFAAACCLLLVVLVEPQYLEVLMRYAAHPSASVSLLPLRTTRALLRNEALARCKVIVARLPQLMLLVLGRLPRVHDPPCAISDDADDAESAQQHPDGGQALHMSAQFAELDFDEADSYSAFYGQFRASALQLIQEMARAHPLEMMKFGASMCNEMAGVLVLPPGHTAGAVASLDAPPALAQEAALTFIEQVISSTSKHRFVPGSADASTFAAAAEAMLHPLLQLPADALSPLVLEKQLHCVARFTPYLTYHLALLPLTMDTMLRHAAYRTVEEAASGCSPESLSARTCQLRQRACVSMTHLCKGIDPTKAERNPGIAPQVTRTLLSSSITVVVIVLPPAVLVLLRCYLLVYLTVSTCCSTGVLCQAANKRQLSYWAWHCRTPANATRHCCRIYAPTMRHC